ncbi:MAG: uncharacterized protein A8A55_2565 [Amphiamblys sp. WSBS2006]|nr:MAG: uncharacterized protein A8A55_2565 [Amphiamblys sp. WSBS2006]
MSSVAEELFYRNLLHKMKITGKEAVLITKHALDFTLTELDTMIEKYSKQLKKEHLRILENPAVKKFKKIYQESEETLERLRISYELKEKYNAASPFKKMFPFCPSKTNEHMPFLCGILNPVLTKEISSEREALISLENAESQLFNLKEAFEDFKRIQSLPEGEDTIMEAELQKEFCKFLECFFTGTHVVRTSVHMKDNTEADIMLRETYTGNSFSIIEVKKDGRYLEAAVFQAALYAIQRSMTRGFKGIYILNVAAVCLPEISSRLGRITLKLGDGGKFESCSLEITEPVKWEDDGEEACRFLNHIGSCIENLNDDETQ